MSTITDTDSDTDPSTEHTQDAFSVGDVVADRERDTDGDPVVVNLPPVAAREWTVYRADGRDVTVADDNPGHNPEAAVVVVMFDDDLDAWGDEWDGERPIPLAEAPNGTTYAFPPARLEHTGGRYGKADDTAAEPTEAPDADDDTEATGGAPADDTAAEPTEAPDADDDTEATGGAPADDTEATTLRDRLDAIADTVAELNVDDVAVDTFREVVVVEKLGKQYAIDTDGTVGADDLLAGKLEDALAERPEVGE